MRLVGVEVGEYNVLIVDAGGARAVIEEGPLL